MSAFTVVRAMHLHPPYGLWIVSHGGEVIGRQISRPGEADCRAMLVRHLEGRQQLAFYEDRWAKEYGSRGVAALARQRRGGRAKAAHHKIHARRA